LTRSRAAAGAAPMKKAAGHDLDLCEEKVFNDVDFEKY
jgi:hypothetical protein